jgi:hypothetical protein
MVIIAGTLSGLNSVSDPRQYCPTGRAGRVAHDRPYPPYLGNPEYPRGFVGGKALKLHFFFPHFEQRIRFATSSSRASHPHNRPKVCGSAVRSWPHSAHLSTNVYWPNSSLNLLIWNSRAIGADCYDRTWSRPSSTRPDGTLYRQFVMARRIAVPDELSARLAENQL